MLKWQQLKSWGKKNIKKKDGKVMASHPSAIQSIFTDLNLKKGGVFN